MKSRTRVLLRVTEKKCFVLNGEGFWFRIRGEMKPAYRDMYALSQQRRRAQRPARWDKIFFLRP